jgi:exonuclease III
VCIQETKLSSVCNVLAIEILGPAFDYVFLPTVGVARGIILAWCRDEWLVDGVNRGQFCISARFRRSGSSTQPWWVTGVYGPQEDDDKVEFLAELLQFRDASPGPWLLGGDFNMIYHAQDKNNDRLDCQSMRQFRSFIDRAQLEEINMVGRCFSWSNRRDRPTLELLDWVFVSMDWLLEFPSHALKPLSSQCSDHCPLLLLINVF